jgi:hypothetical protein
MVEFHNWLEKRSGIKFREKSLTGIKKYISFSPRLFTACPGTLYWQTFPHKAAIY